MGQFSAIEFGNYKGAFWAEYDSSFEQNYAAKVANIFADVYGEDAILATVGGVRPISEWRGERDTHTPVGYKQTISSRVFEDNITIPIESYKRSGPALWEPKVREMARMFSDHWQDLCVEVLLGSTLGFDGLALFSASHVGGSNLLTNSDVATLDVTTAAAPTAEEMATALIDVSFYMQTLKNEQDVLVNKNAQRFLMLSSNPKLLASAKRAINADQLAQGASSPLAGLVKEGFGFEAVLDASLGSATSAVFYLLRTDSESKAIILMDEFPIESQELGAGTDFATLHNKYFYGMKAVRGAGVGTWQRVVKCTLS